MPLLMVLAVVMHHKEVEVSKTSSIALIFFTCDYINVLPATSETASANSEKFSGIRTWMYIDDLL